MCTRLIRIAMPCVLLLKTAYWVFQEYNNVSLVSGRKQILIFQNKFLFLTCFFFSYWRDTETTSNFSIEDFLTNKLREKCPYSEFFLVRIFQHSNWILTWKTLNKCTFFSDIYSKSESTKFNFSTFREILNSNTSGK